MQGASRALSGAIRVVVLMLGVGVLLFTPKVVQADDNGGCHIYCPRWDCNMTTGICTGTNCTITCDPQ